MRTRSPMNIGACGGLGSKLDPLELVVSCPAWMQGTKLGTPSGIRPLSLRNFSVPVIFFFLMVPHKGGIKIQVVDLPS